MDRVSVSKFRDKLKAFVEEVVDIHVPQNKTLMRQIAASLKTHSSHDNYQTTQDDIDEITGL